jgi:phenylalanyl-tRNA synthetase alpha chain
MRALPENDYQVLTALAGREEPVSVDELAAELGLDQAKVAAVCLTRAADGEVQVQELAARELRLGKAGRELPEAVLPERRIVTALAAAEGALAIPDVAREAGLEPKVVGQTLRWLKAKGWAKKQGKTLAVTDEGRRVAGQGELGADEALVRALAGAGALDEEGVRAAGVDLDAARAALAGRKGIVDEKERKTRLVSLTDAGRGLVAGGIRARREVNQLTSEMLVSGGWRDVDLRPYDVTLGAQPAFPGKEHPLVSIFQQTRRVFLEMGFSEIASPFVESSFWDFDALFQPQDHPARDMQDTFYVKRPGTCKLPGRDVVDAVARTHQDGGDTGSVGWRYDWDRALARRPVLRTHTTAATIRALAKDPRGPRKVFCVGPVFRRETVDFKHLPIFHQVDGIIIDEHASLATLLGTLSAFYEKMGFERFHFQPAFYPYTEPSVDVFVWSEDKQDYVEMGGSGIFRPEVTEPFGCTTPVLAWGLGMERLAMFRYGLPGIGELYRAHLGWLKEAPLCR